jgi:hypothetical protein
MFCATLHTSLFLMSFTEIINFLFVYSYYKAAHTIGTALYNYKIVLFVCH